MSLKDQLVDVPVQCGAGRMHLEGHPVPIAVFTVNFGTRAGARTEQFLTYEKISLTIAEVNKFLYTYTIHSDELFCKTKDGTLGTEEAAHEDIVHEFSIVHTVPRGAHKLFVNARRESGGQWVLLLRSNTMLFLLVDARGNILRKEMRPGSDTLGMDWKDPPLA